MLQTPVELSHALLRVAAGECIVTPAHRSTISSVSLGTRLEAASIEHALFVHTSPAAPCQSRWRLHHTLVWVPKSAVHVWYPSQASMGSMAIPQFENSVASKASATKCSGSIYSHGPMQQSSMYLGRAQGLDLSLFLGLALAYRFFLHAISNPIGGHALRLCVSLALAGSGERKHVRSPVSTR